MEASEKIEVFYSFSPLLGKMHFIKASNKARALGDNFPELTIRCREHWPSHLNTIQITGFIKEEESNLFLSEIQELQELMEVKS